MLVISILKVLYGMYDDSIIVTLSDYSLSDYSFNVRVLSERGISLDILYSTNLRLFQEHFAQLSG